MQAVAIAGAVILAFVLTQKVHTARVQQGKAIFGASARAHRNAPPPPPRTVVTLKANSSQLTAFSVTRQATQVIQTTTTTTTTRVTRTLPLP